MVFTRQNDSSNFFTYNFFFTTFSINSRNKSLKKLLTNFTNLKKLSHRINFFLLLSEFLINKHFINVSVNFLQSLKQLFLRY